MQRAKTALLVRICGPSALVVLIIAGSNGDTSTAAQSAVRGRPVIELEERPAFPLPAHLESKDIGAGKLSYAQLFSAGAKLFHTSFNGLDGVGMRRTVGGTAVHRFSNGPAGGGQPTPVGAQACSNCHNQPVDGGSGLAHTRVLFDPGQKGAAPFSPRATTSLFGNGVLQLLAQEMTQQLLAARDAAAQEARSKPGMAVRRQLTANGVDFGIVAATSSSSGDVTFDMAQVRGVSPDLVVRPLGWKGNITTVRNFSVAAASFGMGMQAEEFVWRVQDKLGVDADGDGVSRELSVGDVTAMAIFNAALPVPADIGRLAALGLVAAPDAASKQRIESGRQLFSKVGCASCHVPEMRLAGTVFEEPTLAGGGQYLDRFLAGKDPDYDPKRPVRFDVLKDAQEPRVEPAPGGGAVVRLYGDLKRHDMGRHMADPGGPQPPLTVSLTPLQHEGKLAFIGASEFMTAELWGVGNTGPWMHDDRAGTLAEAIVLHGEDSPPAPGQPGRSEAQDSRDAFVRLSKDEQTALVTFLKSLVTVAKAGDQSR